MHKKHFRLYCTCTRYRYAGYKYWYSSTGARKSLVRVQSTRDITYSPERPISAHLYVQSTRYYTIYTRSDSVTLRQDLQSSFNIFLLFHYIKSLEISKYERSNGFHVMSLSNDLSNYQFLTSICGNRKS